MPNFNARPLVGLGLILATLSAPAYANVVTLSSVSAAWQNAVPAANAIIDNSGATVTARWGGASGYDFTAASGTISESLPPSPSPLFAVGTFNHVNFPVSTSITGIQLKVSADIGVNGTDLGVHTFLFNFIHNETPNGTNPCADGGTPGVGIDVNGCADNVSFVYNPVSESFLIGSDLYTVTLQGFSQDGGKTITSSLWTMENSNNIATLYGYVGLTNGNKVPEPGTLALLGLAGLAGLAAARRRA